ncbi:MAG: hypothetical protein ACRDQA_11805 [Nocardioidaceae bacterium]
MSANDPDQETYNPWTVVHVVFDHLTDHGLRPTLGEAGDPSEPAAALLHALGIGTVTKPDTPMTEDVREELATLRQAIFEDP